MNSLLYTGLVLIIYIFMMQMTISGCGKKADPLPPLSNTAFISIGSNIGDKYVNCMAGITCLNNLESTKVIDTAPFYKTEPVDYKEQDWFLNSILKIETKLEPDILMVSLKNIEKQLGQYEKKIRFGPRIIDLDIIFYGDLVINTDRVTIPHPRMDKRCFVLKPLCDIAPELKHPLLGYTMKELLKNIENDDGQDIILFKTC